MSISWVARACPDFDLSLENIMGIFCIEISGWFIGEQGAAVKGFNKAVKEGEDEPTAEKLEQDSGEVIEGEVTSKEKDKS